MARAAVIPQSPPKRATRGRAKGTTTTATKTAGKQGGRVTKAVAETKKQNARVTAPQTNTYGDSGSEEEETDDEIGVIDSKSRGKTSATKGKSTGRGRKAAAAATTTTDHGSDSENDDDELAQSSDAPKKRAGRPKAKASVKEGGRTTKTAATTPRPRGRPKGTTTAVRATTAEDVLRENTRKNARARESEGLMSSQQGRTEIFIATGSALLRGPAKKKKVTFQEMSDSDEGDLSEAPAPTTRRKRGTVVAKDQEGMGAKPVRKAPAPATRGRKPAAAKKGGGKPLSPKKPTQVAKAISSYVSSDDEDELNGEKDDLKLLVHSPQKRMSGIPGLGSPVRKINFTPNKASSKAVDENGEPNLQPPKTFDFGDAEFMSSPARRPPPSPFQFTLKETPKRGALSFDQTEKLARPETTPMQNSPLRTSPKKARLGTPGRGSLFGHNPDVIAQPNLNPAHNSPLKTSPKKGIFGASFAAQQHSHQGSTPFKSSLLLSPAKKIITPFKSSMARVPSSLAKESQVQADTETDDETVSMYDDSPLRSQNFEGVPEFDADEVSSDGRDARLTPEGSPVARGAQQSEEEDLAQFGNWTESAEVDQGVLSEEDEIPQLETHNLGDDVEYTDRDADDIIEGDEAELGETDIGAPFDYEDDENGSTTPPGVLEAAPNVDELIEELEEELEEEFLENEHEHADTQEDDSDMEVNEERSPSARKHSRVDGLEDVFTEDYPSSRIWMQDNAVDDANDSNEGSMSDDEDPVDFVDHSTPHEDNDEPTLVGEVGEGASDDLMDAEPISPYEIEEVEDTPFMNFLLTHWAPTLPCVDECEPTITIAPVEFTERRSPCPKTPEEDQSDVSSSPSLSTGSKHDSPSNNKEEPQGPSLRSRGPRFTLLAEQLSQWQASSPAKAEAKRPHRRGVFSLGRSSDASSAAARAPGTDIFANAPSFSTKIQPRTETYTAQTLDTPEELTIHEDEEDPMVEAVVDSTPASSARRPMAEIVDEQEAPGAPELFSDSIYGEMDEPQAKTADYSTLKPSLEEKENERISPVPATPAKNPSLPRQTYHTVSKVPLKPEGEMSPLKINRKRGRSLSITSPVRSSPRLRDFVFPAHEPRMTGSPPRKSPRLQQGSPRKSQSKEPLAKTVESAHKPRSRTPSRTPSRSASPSKTPRKQVPAYEQCLHGAVVYVDVHTTEGEDASGIFIELLQQMGAKCIRNWSWNPRMSVSPEEDTTSLNGRVGITHVVFKDGGVRTLEKVRQASGLVKCVGVGWVLDCEREDKWLDETPYSVDSSIIPRGGAKRRKSMEPRALSNINGTLIKADTSGSSSRRPSAAFGTSGRSTTPVSGDDRFTPGGTRGYEPGHTEGDQKCWQTPRTPGAAAFGFNLDSIGMSPATPFYLNQRSKLVQQTCPPKQTRQGLFSRTAEEGGPSRELKTKLEAARRKSLAFKPAVGSPLVE
ncbi:hypothetical protein BJX76DRAFT_203621 [Aspergillus varians]